MLQRSHLQYCRYTPQYAKRTMPQILRGATMFMGALIGVYQLTVVFESRKKRESQGAYLTHEEEFFAVLGRTIEELSEDWRLPPETVRGAFLDLKESKMLTSKQKVEQAEVVQLVHMFARGAFGSQRALQPVGKERLYLKSQQKKEEGPTPHESHPRSPGNATDITW